MTQTARGKKRRQAGFSLVELTVSVLILVIIMGAVFKQVDAVQKHTNSESMKLDLAQENRDFVDRFARDVHMSGYPVSKLYQTFATNDKTVALGLVAATPTWLRFEGDVYGDGNVYSVVYKYVQSDPSDASCPCLRRSVQLKQPADPLVENAAGGTAGQLPAKYYTEVQHLIDPTGMSQNLFTYSEANGNIVDVGTGVGYNGSDPTLTNDPATLQKIDQIKVSISTRSAQADMSNQQQIVNSIVTVAEMEN